MGLTAKRFTQGFTLVELVIVIIVLGILSAVAIPKFASRSGFEDYAVRDQLIARLRLVQLQNMNADVADNASENACYWLVVSSDCFYSAHSARVDTLCSDPASNVCSDDSFSDAAIVTFPAGMLASGDYRFDISGRFVIDNTAITSVYEIAINGDNNLQVSIETEGFIHDGS